MPMEIRNPTTAEFIPLLGAFNFEYRCSNLQSQPSVFSFGINWEKEGDGQGVLRDHLRTKTPFRVRHYGQEYQGVLGLETGINTANGMVMAYEIAG